MSTIISTVAVLEQLHKELIGAHISDKSPKPLSEAFPSLKTKINLVDNQTVKSQTEGKTGPQSATLAIYAPDQEMTEMTSIGSKPTVHLLLVAEEVLSKKEQFCRRSLRVASMDIPLQPSHLYFYCMIVVNRAREIVEEMGSGTLAVAA